MTMRAGPEWARLALFPPTKNLSLHQQKKPIGTDRQAFRFFAKLLINERVLRMNHRGYLP